jgi:hypothetical protein
VARTVTQISTASIAGGGAALAVVLAVTHALGHGHVGSLVGLIGGAGVGLAVLATVAWRMHIPEIQDMARLVRPVRAGESGRP